MRPRAASTQRAALLAISVCRWISFSTIVSAICASTMGAVTSSRGSLGKTAVPSGTARTSPLKEKPRSRSRKAALKRPVLSRKARSSSQKVSSSR